MAKTIEDLIVKLKAEGFENIDKLRGSFRELNKVTYASELQIKRTREELLDLAKQAGNTETVNKGLIEAFKGLRAQADLCGAAYTELTRDIADLEAASRGYTAQAVAQRASLSAQYGAITNNTEALRRQRTALIELQQATRGGSQLFTQLGADIQKTTARLEEIEGIQRRTNATLNRALPSSSVKIRRDLQDVRDRISLEQAELDRLQTLTAAERKQFSQGTELRGQSGVTRAIAEQERVLATFRQQAGALELSENVRQRRQAVRDANALFMSPEFTGTGSRTAEGLTRSFGDLPNTIAGINQGLSELRNRLDNTTIGTTAFTDAAIRAAAAQRELREATQGVAAAFVQQLRTGEIAPSLTNLREVISSVRTEQGLLDTSSTGGARAFQLLERQARSLERQLSALQTTQASLAATPVSGFAAFSQSVTPQEGDKIIQGSIRRNRERQERERRRLEREVADFYSSQPTAPLLLPAAGQTSAPGTGLEISGGANVRAGRRRSVTDVIGNIPVMGVRPGSGVQRFFGSADVEAAALYPGAVPMGPRMTSRQEGENRTRVITETAQAYDTLGKAVERSRRPLRDIYADIDKTTKASNGSVNSLEAQIGVWTELRNAVGRTAPAFDTATKKLEQLTARRERLTGGRRLSGMQLAQGVGAALSGGIFGGPEGLIGGLGGLAVGGVGGAFAGAAFGAQVGMVRQQLGVFTEQAAAISKLRIGLASVSTDLREFEASTRAVEGASQSLLIPLADTYRYYTQLRASTVELNYSANDTRQILEGTASAVLKTGGSLADVDGAMRAVVQILSKGKAAAEEVRGQLGERFPGAVIKFAQANKMSVQELDQAFQAGSVTIEQFITFARKNYEDGGKYVENLSNSTEYAGKRMEKALENLRLAVGRSLKESGANFQNFAADAAESLLWLGQQLSAFGDAAERALGGTPGPTGNAKEIAERIIGGGTTVAAVEEAIRAYEEKVKEAKDRLNAVKTRNIFQFIFDETFGQGTPTQEQTDRTVSSFESRIQSLREALKLANEYTRRGKPGVGSGSGSEDPAAADRAKSLLSAIEQREEALTQARIQREEQIADIRKQSIEQARQLERQFADERRNLEREIATTKRGITDVEEDIARQRRLLAGEDPRLIEAEQRVADVYREAREKDIKAKEDYADREFNRARTIADFQKNVADQINKANEAYARQIGKIHRGYATDVGKILDEASGKTAKRLSIAVKLMDAFRELDMLQSARLAVGESPVPSADIQWQPGEVYGDTLKKIRDLERQLRQSRRSPSSTEDRFFTAYANTPVRDYGPIASASLQGIFPRYTEGMVASRPWREGDFVGGGAVRPIPVTPAAQGAAAASDAAAAAARLKAENELELELLKIREDSLRPLSEQTTRLAEQNSLYKAQQDYIKSGITPALAEQYAQFDQLGELQRRIADSQTRKAVDEAQRQGATADRIAKLVEDHRQLNSAIDENVRNAKNLAAAYEAAQQAARFMQDSRIGLGFQEGAQAYVQSIGTMREATSQLAQTGIKGIEDAIFSLVTTGTANFQEFAKSILENTARMIIQQLILRSVMQIIGAIAPGGGSFGKGYFDPITGKGVAGPNFGFAMGGAFAKNGIVPFAMGGVVKRPTMFAFANGGAGRLGLMGEAGPEAIMPLRRLPSGRLGVEAAGGGNAVKVDNITINVENSGEQLSPAAQKQIAGQVRGIVLATLVDQRRGGGVLR